MSFNIPNVFIAGKKAIADEVNENFETIKDEINSHKSKIATLTSSVESFDEALNGGLREDMETLIKNAKALFCANKGNTNENGEGDLLVIDSLSPNSITFKVSAQDGEFSPITYTNYKGSTVVKTSFNSVNMNDLEDGTYIIYANPNGEVYPLKGVLTKSKIEPENMATGDVWLDLSKIPFEAKTHNGISYEEFLDVPIGEAVILEGVLAEVKTYPYNQNGFDVNTQTVIDKTALSDSIFHNNMPNYDNYIQKAVGVEHIAEEDGYISFRTHFTGSQEAKLHINNCIFAYKVPSGNNDNTFLYPIAKGYKYWAEGNVVMYWIKKLS